MDNDINDNKIAIIGVSTYLPGAPNTDIFWSNLCAGLDSSGYFPKSREKILAPYITELNEECSFKAGAYLNDISSFDYNFFKIPKVEAIAMQPSQRLFLESVVTALEDAGYGGHSWYGRNIGVYVGYIGNMEMTSYQHIVNKMGSTISSTGNLSSSIAGRISYFMNFTGESILLDSACSSSFAALKYACHALKNHECEGAIVGGVQINVFPRKENYSIGIESPDGRTRPFDLHSCGTGEGEGVATVILKLLHKAIADKDNIYCILENITSNQDGRSMGLSAPNPKAQIDLIKKSFLESHINPADISYMELHGTGTKLGDPIELNALNMALKVLNVPADKQFYIGSVKANIGHSFACSGIAALIKCCLMLKNEKICPQTNFTSMNSDVHNDDERYLINGSLIDWLNPKESLKCSISNFGLSGTNYHCILSSYKQEKSLTEEIPQNELFVLSALTKASLSQMVNKLLLFLMEHRDLPLSNICYTLATGRGHYLHRLSIICSSIDQLIKELKDFRFCSSPDNFVYYSCVKQITDNRKQTRFGEQNTNTITKLNKDIDTLLNNNNLSPIILQRISSAYISGATINWNKLYNHRDLNKINLPTYAFDKTNCWPEKEDI